MDAIVKDMQAQNLVTYLELQALTLGTDSQRERHVAGVLPEDEIVQLAHAELFKGFAAFPRWNGRVRTRMLQALRHAKECPRGKSFSRAWGAFEVHDVAELGAEQWERLKQILAMVAAVNVHPWLAGPGLAAFASSMSHWLTCPDCQAEEVRSLTKVSIPWAGRVLVREFQL